MLMYTSNMKQHHTEIHSIPDKSIPDKKCLHNCRQDMIIARLGTSYNHTRIVSNLIANLFNILADSPYKLLMDDIRLALPKRSRYAYPDLFITQGAPEYADGCNYSVTNPKVIFEVWSKAAASYDNKIKFRDYWTLSTFEEYVLINPDHHQVRYFRRMKTGQWDLHVITNMEDCLTLQTANIELPIETIYRNTH